MDDQIYLDILRRNRGFDQPEEWISYAREHRFRHVPARTVGACPDCGSSSARRIGQYVYYCTLMHLCLCLKCGLAYADTVLSDEVTRNHWDVVYKDENYFIGSREAIFDAVVDLIDRCVPPHGAVLDIGGAKGHLMQLLKARRPDINAEVNDICEISCSHARSRGIPALCCPLKDLHPQSKPYDCLVMLDVIYYEPDVASAWAALGRITGPGSTIIIRIPHRLWLINATQTLGKLFRTQTARRHQTQIRFYNPEYVLALSQAYLGKRLQSIGFDRISFLPSPMPVGRGGKAVCRAAYRAALTAHRVTGGRLVLSPSQIVVASNALGAPDYTRDA